jgi:hypothetical protein
MLAADTRAAAELASWLHKGDIGGMVEKFELYPRKPAAANLSRLLSSWRWIV